MNAIQPKGSLWNPLHSRSCSFQTQSKYILSFVQCSWKSVEFHSSVCSSSGKVLFSSDIRSSIIPFLLQQRFTIAHQKERRNFLSLSSSRKRGGKRDYCNKGLVFLSRRSSFVSTISISKTTSNSLIHQGIPIIPSPEDCNPLHLPRIQPSSKDQKFLLGHLSGNRFSFKDMKRHRVQNLAQHFYTKG